MEQNTYRGRRKITMIGGISQAHFNYETRSDNSLRSIAKYLVRRPFSHARSYRQEYEAEFARCLGDRVAAISFGAGRMALYAILEAYGIGAGDEVIVPAFTCEVVALALKYRGIRPVYVDIEPYTFNIDCGLLEDSISPRTRAIIAQHTFGIPCDLARIKAIAARHRLKVIEDCALSLGAMLGGNPVGVAGDAAIFSTDVTKVTSTMFGGMAVTQDPNLAKELRIFAERSSDLSKPDAMKIMLESWLAKIALAPTVYRCGKHGLSVLRRLGLLFDFVEDRTNFKPPIGYPSRMSDYQCFLGLGQLKALSGNLQQRAALVEQYTQVLNRKGVLLGWQQIGAPPPQLRFSMLVRHRRQFESWASRIVEIGKWFSSPIQGWDKELEQLGYSPGQCPVAERVCAHVVNLPTHPSSNSIRRRLVEFVEQIEPGEILPNASLSRRDAISVPLARV